MCGMRLTLLYSHHPRHIDSELPEGQFLHRESEEPDLIPWGNVRFADEEPARCRSREGSLQHHHIMEGPAGRHEPQGLLQEGHLGDDGALVPYTGGNGPCDLHMVFLWCLQQLAKAVRCTHHLT